MKKPLPANARAKTVRDDAVAVLGDRVKMAEWMWHIYKFPYQNLFYIIARSDEKVNFETENFTKKQWANLESHLSTALI